MYVLWTTCDDLQVSGKLGRYFNFRWSISGLICCIFYHTLWIVQLFDWFILYTYITVLNAPLVTQNKLCVLWYHVNSILLVYRSIGLVLNSEQKWWTVLLQCLNSCWDVFLNQKYAQEEADVKIHKKYFQRSIQTKCELTLLWKVKVK